MKKVLLIAHYFSPLNSTGARRPEALVRYLAKEGYEVTVLTSVKSKLAPSCDLTEGKVCTIESSVGFTRELLGIPRSSSGFNSIDAANSLLIRLKRGFINPVLGQLPDPRLPFVVSVIAKLLINRLSRGTAFRWINSIQSADYLISTSPPWICHLLAVILARWLKIKLVIDYRDQFSGNHMFSQRLSWAERRLDALFCQSASLIVTVSESMAEHYRSLTVNPVIVVMNGFDENHFLKRDALNRDTLLSNRQYFIRYFGTVTPDRLMPSLWIALKSVKQTDNLRFEFYGDCDILRVYLEKEYPSVLSSVAFLGPVAHAQAVNLMYESDALLFSETSGNQYASQRGVLTTKLFEYMAVGKPIIGVIDANTAAGEILLRSGLALVVNTNPKSIENILASPPSSWSKNVKPDLRYISNFSRSSQFQILEKNIVAL